MRSIADCSYLTPRPLFGILGKDVPAWGAISADFDGSIIAHKLVIRTRHMRIERKGRRSKPR